jgi:antitoxin VapB
MALNIRNHETEKLAADLAALTGETKTEAVTKALKDRLEQVRVAGTERIIVAINPAERACRATLGGVMKSTRFRPLLVQSAAFHDGYLEMDPITFGVFLVE